jgi:nucleotide-binding universal stress UspA family protein
VLAKKHDSEIIVLHMLEVSSMSLSESAVQVQEMTFFYLKLAEKRFKDFLKKEYLKGVKVTPVVKHFKIFSEVNTIAEESKADLIIMGSHGTSGMKEMLLGSNTEKVVRSSSIPVLVIKKEQKNISFDDVVFASDFSEESIDSYKRVMKTLSLLAENVHLVHVNTPYGDFKSSLEIENNAAKFLKKAEGKLDKLNTIHYVADYSIEKGIFNFCNVVGADLVAIVTHGRKGFAHFLSGSISEDIANHSTLPVITFKM